MKHIRLFIAFVAALLAASCQESHGPGHEELLEAERLIDIWELDSARVLMAGLEKMPFADRGDTALYALNKIRLEKMRRVILPNDSLAEIATSYFDDGSHPRRAMLAWYYRACSQFDNRHYSSAVKSARRMKVFADQIGAYLYQARFGDIMANCAELVGDNLSAARYFTYAMNRYKEHISPDDLGYIYYFFVEARRSWLRAGRTDSALILSTQMKPIILSHNDSTVRSNWMSNHATLLLNEKEFDDARRFYPEMDSLHVNYDPSAPNHRIARLLIRALADGDNQAMDSALMLEAEYGAGQLSYGYFLHDLTPAEMLDDHAAGESVDPMSMLDSLDEPEATADADDESAMGLVFTIAGLIALLLALALYLFSRRK